MTLTMGGKIIFGDIKDDMSMNPKGIFKDSSDKEFALHLFKYNK